MKRFASHYLFLSLSERYSNYYVELSGREVVKVRNLDQEIESTVWLNGSILLFPILLSELDFKDFFSGDSWQLPGDINNISKDRKVYAYYVPCLDIETIRNLPATDFQLLAE